MYQTVWICRNTLYEYDGDNADHDTGCICLNGIPVCTVLFITIPVGLGTGTSLIIYTICCEVAIGVLGVVLVASIPLLCILTRRFQSLSALPIMRIVAGKRCLMPWITAVNLLSSEY